MTTKSPATATTIANAWCALGDTLAAIADYGIRGDELQRLRLAEQQTRLWLEGMLWCQNCGEWTTRGTASVNSYGWGPRCPRCQEDDLQLGTSYYASPAEVAGRLKLKVTPPA